jgi:DNA-binding response OmpR family regulator
MRTDLSVLLRKMLENFEYMFSQKGLRVTSSIPSGMVAYCDREKVERIVFNLMSNAVKYTPAHGEIDIRAGVEDGRASITVADTGIGISPDKMARIFDRYERVGEKVGDQLPSGFGIGLNYAQHLAHLHKGEISVRSNDPMGSVFTFSFPCRKADFEDANIWQEAAEKQNDTPAEATVADTGGVHILVVEDNPDMREYIRGFLREDYHVTMAGDGEEAWKCIRISAPDLIVSDVMMPYKDGYTLCKEIKNDPEYCHIPVILLTAKADMENQIHGLELGADGYLGKPFDPAFLTALVRNLIAGRQRLQGLLADRTSSSEEPVEDDALSQQDRVFLEKCYRIIDTHLDDEAFGVIGLSMEMGMSRTSIFSKVKALTGQSPQGFLTNYRLNKAMELLKTRDFNISEVAYKVGFATLTGFSRSFKNKFGIPPSAV